MADQKGEQLLAERKYLEHVVRSGIEAINHRDFDINSEAWSGFSPEFRLDPSGVSFENAATGEQILPSQAIETMGLQQLLQYQQHLSMAHPTYTTKILEVTTVEMKGNTAQVLLNAESSGMPEGVVRPLMNIFEFKKDQGKWQCTSLSSLSGIDSAA